MVSEQDALLGKREEKVLIKNLFILSRSRNMIDLARTIDDNFIAKKSIELNRLVVDVACGKRNCENPEVRLR